MSDKHEEYTLTPPELADLFGITVQAVHKLIKTKDVKTIRSGRQIGIPSSEIHRLVLDKGHKYPQEVIAFQIVKGGVGKSSLSHALAVRANQYGARVLAIDLDQQGNLSQAFGLDEDGLKTMVDHIEEGIAFESLIHSVTPNLHVIPSNMNNSTLDYYMGSNSRLNIQNAYRTPINTIRNRYDLIVIDCPPAINHSNTAAALAADRVILPVNPDKFSLEGLRISVEELNTINSQFGHDMKLNIVLNRFDQRKTLSHECLQLLNSDKTYQPLLYPCFIRDNQDIANATVKGTSVFQLYNRKSPAREDLDIFARVVLGFMPKEEPQAKEDEKAKPLPQAKERVVEAQV